MVRTECDHFLRKHGDSRDGVAFSPGSTIREFFSFGVPYLVRLSLLAAAQKHHTFRNILSLSFSLSLILGGMCGVWIGLLNRADAHLHAQFTTITTIVIIIMIVVCRSHKSGRHVITHLLPIARDHAFV